MGLLCTQSLKETARRYYSYMFRQMDYLKVTDILNGHWSLLRKLKIIKTFPTWD